MKFIRIKQCKFKNASREKRKLVILIEKLKCLEKITSAWFIYKKWKVISTIYTNYLCVIFGGTVLSSAKKWI